MKIEDLHNAVHRSDGAVLGRSPATPPNFALRADYQGIPRAVQDNRADNAGRRASGQEDRSAACWRMAVPWRESARIAINRCFAGSGVPLRPLRRSMSAAQAAVHRPGHERTAARSRISLASPGAKQLGLLLDALHALPRINGAQTLDDVEPAVVHLGDVHVHPNMVLARHHLCRPARPLGDLRVVESLDDIVLL